MIELEYRLSFNTPAFLGNAEQQAQWRTPPIKALLRQWWRVVKAPQVGYDHRRLLNIEDALFGCAGDSEGASGRSLVQLRLQHWQKGTLANVERGASLPHPEVKSSVGANLYLGYGPIGGKSERSALDPARAENTLLLRIPESVSDEIQQAVQLAAWFGGLGSRSRNGFGSAHWSALAPTPLLHPLSKETLAPLQSLVRKCSQALTLDWPHAIGSDSDGALIWQTRTFQDWRSAMKQLAILKIALRTSPPFKFENGGQFGHPDPLPRHVLAYPAGAKHAVDAKQWGKNGRMANQLRLRLHREGNDYRGVIVHIPCGIPAHMRATVRHLPDEQHVWQQVHHFFDTAQGLTRLGG